MKTIPLFGCDDVAMVDDDAFQTLSKFKWHKHSCGYAARGQWVPSLKKTTAILMHRSVLTPPKGFVVDHIDQNKLNNTRANLRVCTWSENIARRSPIKNRHSKFKGVCWRVKRKNWFAYISKGRKQISVGYFADEREAAKAFNTASRLHFGEFAFQNPIP